MEPCHPSSSIRIVETLDFPHPRRSLSKRCERRGDTVEIPRNNAMLGLREPEGPDCHVVAPRDWFDRSRRRVSAYNSSIISARKASTALWSIEPLSSVLLIERGRVVHQMRRPNCPERPPAFLSRRRAGRKTSPVPSDASARPAPLAASLKSVGSRQADVWDDQRRCVVAVVARDDQVGDVGGALGDEP